MLDLVVVAALRSWFDRPEAEAPAWHRDRAPPMTFLTSWRIDVAADLLRRPNTTVGAVAQQVGYSTPYALSAAFKRVRGISPQEHRELVSS